MSTPTVEELWAEAVRIGLVDSATATVEPQPRPAAPSPPAPVDGKKVPLADRLAAVRKQIPGSLLFLERKPVSAYDDNPVFEERSAAVIVGVSQDLMKKWRQRGWGPNYIQYGPNGPVRYEMKALMEFREFHKVQVRSRK